MKRNTAAQPIDWKVTLVWKEPASGPNSQRESQALKRINAAAAEAVEALRARGLLQPKAPVLQIVEPSKLSLVRNLCRLQSRGVRGR